jgi:branched-chain amino acid transport system ATP-binding protein
MALLELDSVHRHFGGVHAVDGVDLSLERGELRALIGPNGCGKSTLFNLITGTLRPTSGRIRFADHDITGRSPQHIARLGVGRKFQVTSVFDELSVADNLRVAQRKRGALPLDALLTRLRLAERRNVPAGVLSHGERQWVEMGMVLATNPKLLLLDEPTAGMTAPETAATVDLIRDIGASGDVTVLVIEHDVGFLERLDCAVTVMAKGRILRTGSFADVRADADVRALYFGTAA